jgi:hypothetical protein
MKRLACIVGLHKWEPHVEHGEEYNVCSRCGKLARAKPTPEQYAEADRVVNAPPPWDTIGGGGGGA